MLVRLLTALVCPLGALPAIAETTQREAIVIAEGSHVRRQVVALGRDLVVEGEALGDVAVIGGSARIAGLVKGDVIVLGGDARLEPQARVAGDAYVLGGEIEAETGARIDGRSVAYPTAARAWIVLLEGPSLGLPALSPVVLAAKLALLAAWIAATLAILATSGKELAVTAESVREEPFRHFFVGLVAVLAMVLTVVFFTAFAAAVVGVPLLLLVALFAFLLKLWGSVAVFTAFGSVLLRRLRRARRPPITAAMLGLLVLGTIKLLPWVGIWVWTVVTLIGVGAALGTKLGRAEPWLSPLPDPPSGGLSGA